MTRVRERIGADREAAGAIVVALAIPFLFLHERYQPDLSVAAGSTSVDIRLSDVAVLAVVVAAIVAASRIGVGRLGPGRTVWIPGALLLAWLAFQLLRPASIDDTQFSEHAVSFAKFCEYALLALALPLLVRRAQDLTIVLGAFVLWGGVATGVALLQFFGVDILGAWRAGWRQPSFLGHHDFAGLSAVGASLALACIVARRTRTPAARLFWLALAGGALGLVLAGSITSAAGLVVGALALWIASRSRFAPSRRQLAQASVVVAFVVVGVVAVRGDTLADFMRFLGLRGGNPATGVESYSQRTVLSYIGLKIFEDHPVLGVGWQRSSRPEVFERYLPDARRRFPDVVPLAFPSREHPWGVQNLYVQMLADAGVVGLGFLLAVGAGGIVLAWRAAAHAPHPWAAGAGLAILCALLTVAGEWASLGIVSGIPLQAVTCLALGLAAAGAATAGEETGG